MKNIERRDFLTQLGAGATGLAMANFVQSSSNSLGISQANAANNESQTRTFSTERDDGRFVDTAGYLQSTLKNMRPKLAFDPKMKIEDFPNWKNAVREKLIELLCFPEGIPEQPAPQKIWSKPRQGYQLQKWEAYPEPFSVVPFYILIPDGVSQQSPAPTVMCFPGSTSSKESLAGEVELDTGKLSTWKHFKTNQQALYFVQKGFISVAIENPATGELTSDQVSRSSMSNAALWMGRNYLGISVFQKTRILEWLKDQAWVDSTRIATCGHSLGSNPADILGVLYPDAINAVIHNDFVCNWIERTICANFHPPGGSHHTVPGLFQWFDHTDIEAALAPCPLLFTEGGRTMQIDKIRQAYNLNNSAEKIEVHYYAKYATPDLRPYEDKEIPEGVSNEEYFKYVNVDVPNHRFRPERVIPWLAKQFDVK
ncbi:MAG: alpha/beta hydrolase family protein [Gimesia sp.]|nr:alpha/beta hydrolase family protein [Gimesia sp.]